MKNTVKNCIINYSDMATATSAGQIIALEQAVVDITNIQCRRGGRCRRFSPKKRADIGQYALADGNAAVVAHFELNESTIRGIKRRYVEVLESQSEVNCDTDSIHSLPEKKKRQKMSTW